MKYLYEKLQWNVDTAFLMTKSIYLKPVSVHFRKLMKCLLHLASVFKAEEVGHGHVTYA